MQLQAVIGAGGEGKTALVDRWLARMKRSDYGGAARVYGWSFYSQGAGEDRQVSADLFFEQALKWFGATGPRELDPWTRGEQLAALIRRQPTLLVLDGLEPLQFPPGESEGRIKDLALRALLTELAAEMTGLCVITSRLPLRDFAEDTPGIGALRLPPLTAEVGAEVLRRWGVRGSEGELRAAVREVKGHALAVSLMGSYLAKACGGDVWRRAGIGLLAAEDGGRHAWRVMAAYDHWLGEDDRAALRVVGLFDRAADDDALAAVLKTPAIVGLTERFGDGVLGARWMTARAHLLELGLLAGQGVDAHPLVREAFGEMLRREIPAAWAEAHGRLFDHFAGVADERPEGLVGLEPLYRAVVHGCAAGRQGEAYAVYSQRIKRGGEHHSSRKLGAFAADLAAVAHLFERPWTELRPGLSPSNRSWLLGEAGFMLRALGRLTEAVEPLAAGLEMDVEQENWKEAATSAGNLGELLLTLGQLEPPGAVDNALTRARQAVDHADRSGDAFMRTVNRTILADALHQRGRKAAAQALFAEAERLQAEQQPGLPRLYSLRGSRYGDLLLADRPTEARERAEYSLGISTRNQWLLDIALDNLLLGRAALAIEFLDPALAHHHLNAAVAGLRRAGQTQELPRGLLARAALHREIDDPEQAGADLLEARAIAERGGMRLFLVDADLEAARLALARGDRTAAARSYATARDAVLDIRYHRRDPDLESLACALGEPPPEWLYQADVMVELPEPPPPMTDEDRVRDAIGDHGSDTLREAAGRLGIRGLASRLYIGDAQALARALGVEPAD